MKDVPCIKREINEDGFAVVEAVFDEQQINSIVCESILIEPEISCKKII